MNDAQSGVLFGLMTFGPSAWYDHGSRLEPEMFDGERREVFETIAKLNREGHIANVVLVSENCSPEAGELASRILSHVFLTKGEMRSMCEHVRKHYRTNRARDIGAELLETGDRDAAVGALMALDSGGSRPTTSAGESTTALMERLQKRTESDFIGLRTGLRDVDALLGGIEPGSVVVVAARPSMGKTALMLNIADRCGARVGIFSLEMSTPQLMTRLVSARGVDYGGLRRPRSLSDSDWPKVTEITSRIRKEDRIFINETAGIPIGDLESESYRMVKGKGCGLICVDYLQLVTCRAESRLEEVSEISRRIKGIAKNLDVPVLVLSQLNRSVENRPGKKPQLSDLRESGQIEQDADQVILLYRPEVYDADMKPGLAEVIVAKNREGETGERPVAWQGRFQRFMDYTPDRFPRSAA